jgi:hypothetical protein
MLIETRDNAVAVGFADESITGFRPPGRKGVVNIGGLQPCLSAPIHQGSVICVPHNRTPAC